MKKRDDSLELKLSELQDQIDAWDKAGDYTELLPLVAERLQITRELYGDSMEYAAALNDLGGIYRDIGVYDESERLFLEGNELLATIRSKHDPNYATSLLNTAGLYRLMKRFKDAERLFVQAIAIYNETLGGSHFLMTSAMNNLGLLYQDMGEFAKAKLLFERCRDALETSGENRVALGSTLNNLAALTQLMGDYPASFTILQRVLEIYRTELGTEHPLYATALNTYGMYRFSSGDRVGAVETLEEVERITRKRFGQGSSYHNMAIANLEFARKSANDDRT
jgi:tetratricopeptide (TPR) repeat protein